MQQGNKEAGILDESVLKEMRVIVRELDYSDKILDCVIDSLAKTA